MSTQALFDIYLKRFEYLNDKLASGTLTLTRTLNISSGTTPKKAVLSRDRWTLYRYDPVVDSPAGPPVIIVYALVNRYYMMDLQPDRSMVKNFLEMGLDVYVLDWGYPAPVDKYLSLEDYIDDYMNEVVDFVAGRSGHSSITLFGVCQGGTFSAIYTALNPEKIKNLVLLVAPINFDSPRGLLNVWAKHMDIDRMVDVMGNIPGDFMNIGFLMLNPLRLMFAKYVDFVENIDDRAFVSNFIRMERWIFDSPDQAGEAFRKFVKELYQENRLVKGTLEIGGRVVDLRRIAMPVLNVFADLDHLVPPDCSEPFTDLISSPDKTKFRFPTGHIGIFTSSKSQKEFAPKISGWIRDHSVKQGEGKGL